MESQPKTYTSYDEYPAYVNESLWAEYAPERSSFKIFSPLASQAKLNLYESGNGGEAFETIQMKSDQEGLWEVEVPRDLVGTYYTYQVRIDGQWLDETPGIYATAVGVNGDRAMVVNMSATNPEGWESDKRITMNAPNEAIIYELHVRDITSHQNSGSTQPGKYLGLVESGTVSSDGLKTGIDHMKELGITHLHLLPAFDHYSIDETNLDSAQFNWGYDPKNYNVPEGSFSSDPFNAEVRIREFKEMVKAFHDNGIGVILDVVYNHTGRTDESNFNRESPGYYYRQNGDGTWSDASGCGNETASERPMARKFIVESVVFWAREYHLDGFRFDLMGIHDIKTMNAVADAVHQIDPSIFVYGEGWTAGGSPLAPEEQALKAQTHRMPRVSAFSDDIRDGIKGSVFDDLSTGFVSGAEDMEESIKFGVVGSIVHPQIDYEAVNYSDTAWANEPWQAVSYVSCHDNNTLFDKLIMSRADASEAEIIAMQKLANAIVLTSQGIPFLHAGVEMLRTKGGEHNSYNQPDQVNQIDWDWKSQNINVFEYHQRLIELRKNHPAFYMRSADMVRSQLTFGEDQNGLVSFTISGNANGDSWSEIRVIYNARNAVASVDHQGMQVAVLGDQFYPNEVIYGKENLTVPPISMAILYKL
ncbi:MAG: type I pullulanase [Cyclobacteriaceae bacterium]